MFSRVRTFVNRMHNVIRGPVSQSALSVSLLIGSALWWVGSLAHCTASAFTQAWSATPLFWLLVVLVTPAICFASGLILTDGGKRRRFSRLERCALLAGVFPVSLGTLLAVWTVKVLLSMSGVA